MFPAPSSPSPRTFHDIPFERLKSAALVSNDCQRESGSEEDEDDSEEPQTINDNEDRNKRLKSQIIPSIDPQVTRLRKTNRKRSDRLFYVLGTSC